MKKVLILAYDFPPYNSVGAQRPYSWYKYFKEYDVFPIVVTRNWDGITYGSVDAFSRQTVENVRCVENELGIVYYTPFEPNFRDRLLLKKRKVYKIIRKFFTVYFRLMSYLTLKNDNRSAIYHQSREILQKNSDIEFIIATGEPFILFKYAHLLSKEFNIPWHADYRDDWINNHTDVLNGGFQMLLLRVERIFEKKYLSNVNSFSSVSDFLVNDIKKRTGIKKGFIVENGVDLSMLKQIEFRKSSDFLISYTGIMYDYNYMNSFFDGFSMFMQKYNCDKRIRLRFVGVQSVHNQAVEKTILLKEKFPNNVEIIERVSMKKALEFQLESTILLNLIAGDPSRGLIGAKTYSYAATKNPILSVPVVDNKNSFFFPNRNIHTIAFTKEEICSYLSNYFDVYLKGTQIKTDISEDEIFVLSREYNSKKILSMLFNNDVLQ